MKPRIWIIDVKNPHQIQCQNRIPILYSETHLDKQLTTVQCLSPFIPLLKKSGSSVQSYPTQWSTVCCSTQGSNVNSCPNDSRCECSHMYKWIIIQHVYGSCLRTSCILVSKFNTVIFKPKFETKNWPCPGYWLKDPKISQLQSWFFQLF